MVRNRWSMHQPSFRFQRTLAQLKFIMEPKTMIFFFLFVCVCWARNPFNQLIHNRHKVRETLGAPVKKSFKADFPPGQSSPFKYTIFFLPKYIYTHRHTYRYTIFSSKGFFLLKRKQMGFHRVTLGWEKNKKNKISTRGFNIFSVSA